MSKIIQITTAVEVYKNGEVYTDVYGLGENGSLYIHSGLEWILVSSSNQVSERGK
jgi:hypothetical protein|tara:strand:- start:5508 stop:5672 length:165 start_codon:yes stop_codon:yes gene_type:complete